MSLKYSIWHIIDVILLNAICIRDEHNLKALQRVIAKYFQGVLKYIHLNRQNFKMLLFKYSFVRNIKLVKRGMMADP